MVRRRGQKVAYEGAAGLLQQVGRRPATPASRTRFVRIITGLGNGKPLTAREHAEPPDAAREVTGLDTAFAVSSSSSGSRRRRLLHEPTCDRSPTTLRPRASFPRANPSEVALHLFPWLWTSTPAGPGRHPRGFVLRTRHSHCAGASLHGAGPPRPFGRSRSSPPPPSSSPAKPVNVNDVPETTITALPRSAPSSSGAAGRPGLCGRTARCEPRVSVCGLMASSRAGAGRGGG